VTAASPLCRCGLPYGAFCHRPADWVGMEGIRRHRFHAAPEKPAASQDEPQAKIIDHRFKPGRKNPAECGHVIDAEHIAYFCEEPLAVHKSGPARESLRHSAVPGPGEGFLCREDGQDWPCRWAFAPTNTPLPAPEVGTAPVGELTEDEMRAGRARAAAVEALSRIEDGRYCGEPSCPAELRALAVAGLSGMQPLPECPGHISTAPVADETEGGREPWWDEPHEYPSPLDVKRLRKDATVLLSALTDAEAFMSALVEMWRAEMAEDHERGMALFNSSGFTETIRNARAAIEAAKGRR
jgi:hypothetical protein